MKEYTKQIRMTYFSDLKAQWGKLSSTISHEI